MQSNNRHLSFSSFSSFPRFSSFSSLAIFKTIATLASLATLAAACGGVSPLVGTSDPVCDTLANCCSSIGGQTGSTCSEMQSSAKLASNGSSCQSVLQSYQAEGYCGGVDGGGASVGIDGGGNATGSCATTGACFDAGTTPSTSPTTSCQTIGTCASGQTYATCVTSGGGQACSASIVFSDGQQLACASCTDCATASSNAALVCAVLPGTGQDAGNDTVDSGPSCGTSPVLHPVTVPGPYCPFTATGAVHCAGGQECCEAPVGQVSSCQAGGSACPIVASLTWECTDPIDCQASDAGFGAVCCAAGTTSYDATCAFNRGTGFSGSHCALGCQPTEVQLCSAANDPCVSPKQCTPFKVEGLVLGTCL